MHRISTNQIKKDMYGDPIDFKKRFGNESSLGMYQNQNQPKTFGFWSFGFGGGFGFGFEIWVLGVLLILT